MTTLGEVTTGRDGIQTGPFGSQLHAHEYTAVGIPVVMPQDLRDNVIDTAEIARVPTEVAERLPRHWLEADDIVLSRRGDVTRRAWIRPEQAGWLCGTGCLRVRPDPTLVNARFLSYALGSDKVRTWLINHAVGATMPNLNTEILSNVPLTLPDLQTQRPIAEVLGSLDDKIAANERVVGLLDKLIRAQVVEHADGDVIRVADLASLVTDRWQPGDEPLPYLGLEHLPRRLLWGGEVGDSDVVTSQKTHFESGDLLFGKLRPYFHKVVVADEPGVCSTDILVLRAKDRALRGWMWAAVSSDAVVAEVTASSTGTKMPRANWSDLSEATVPWPGIAKAKVLSTRFETLNAQAHALLAENRALAATRDALLPALMSGELSVREVAEVPGL